MYMYKQVPYSEIVKPVIFLLKLWLLLRRCQLNYKKFIEAYPVF